MGRDVPDGRLYLDSQASSKWMDSTWTVETSTAYFDHVKTQMQRVADALNGRFEVNPHYLLNRVITVHSLGGSPMADDPDQGVVDRFGAGPRRARAVRRRRRGDARAGRPNPSLTIAAFARWMCANMRLDEEVACMGRPDRSGSPRR